MLGKLRLGYFVTVGYQVSGSPVRVPDRRAARAGDRPGDGAGAQLPRDQLCRAVQRLLAVRVQRAVRVRKSVDEVLTTFPSTTSWRGQGVALLFLQKQEEV